MELRESQDVTRYDCPAGMRQRCEFKIEKEELSEYDGNTIGFWFEISDGRSSYQNQKSGLR